MKKNIIFLILLVLFFWFNLLPRVTAEEEAPLAQNQDAVISMDLKDASLKDLLKMFSVQSGLNFIASEGVQDRKVTLYLDKVPLREAMDKLFKANSLYFDFDKSGNFFIVKDLGKPGPELVTRVFTLKYATVSTSSLKEEENNVLNNESSGSGSTSASGPMPGGNSSTGTNSTGKWKADDVSGITEIVKKLLSSNGSVVEDYRTNSLVVTDSPRNMEVITQTIAALDVSVPQVMLEVEMLDVNKNFIDRLGIKFQDAMTSSLFETALKGASLTSGFPFAGKQVSDLFSRAITPGSIDFSKITLTAFVDMMKQQADTKILARPRVLTVNNETAEIKIATQEAIGTVQQQASGGSITNNATAAERTETGVILRITPQINVEKGEITMFVYPRVKDATTSSVFNTGSTVYKDPEERSTKSVVRVKDGESVIIGGLIRHDKSETITKPYFFGDIPFLGKLFTHRYKDKDRERELIVFITPHLLKEGGNINKDAKKIELVQANKVSLPEREQNTYSGVDRQAIVASSLNKFESKR